MRTRHDATGATWDETVADQQLGRSEHRPEGTVGDLDLPPVEPGVVQRVLARLPADGEEGGWDLVHPLHEAVKVELEPGLARDQARLQAEFDRGEAAAEARGVAARDAAAGSDRPGGSDPGRTGTGGPPGKQTEAGATSRLVLVLLMVTSWVPTLVAMRVGFDGVAWTWGVAASLLVSLACAVALATPSLMARPAAADWQRSTGFGLVAIASTVLVGSVLLRLYGGSTIGTEIVPQFVVLVAVPVLAAAAWVLLRDRTAAPRRRAVDVAAAAATAAEVAEVEELELRLDSQVYGLVGQVPAEDARRALAVELASLQQLFEAGRLRPDVARTAARDAANFWRTPVE